MIYREGQAIPDLAEDSPLYRIAARLSPQFRKRFLQLVYEHGLSLDLNELAAAIEAGAMSEILLVSKLEDLATKMRTLSPELIGAFLAGAEYAWGDLKTVNVTFDFALINPDAVAWARQRLPPLVATVRDGAQEAIRQIVADAVSGNLTSFQVAERVIQWIGLTDRQAEAANAFYVRLLAEGETPVKARHRLERYILAQKRLRAETIARTEIQTASNAGQLAAWNRARGNGLLPADTQRVWIVTVDERLCKVCESLAESTTPLGAAFKWANGSEATTVFGEPLMSPPQHPNCRCTTALVFPGRD